MVADITIGFLAKKYLLKCIMTLDIFWLYEALIADKKYRMPLFRTAVCCVKTREEATIFAQLYHPFFIEALTLKALVGQYSGGAARHESGSPTHDG